MAGGVRILNSLGAFFIGSDGKVDICEDCCSLGTCNCTAGNTDPRIKLTVSWTEDAWQSSHSYMEKTIIKVNISSVDYLFIKQDAGASTSGGTAPTWDTTVGNTTTDSGVTWVRIPDEFQRGYLGCLWSNGDAKEMCSGVYNSGYNASAKNSTEEWYIQKPNQQDFRLYANWSVYPAPTTPFVRIRKGGDVRLHVDSTVTSYGLDGAYTGGKINKRIIVNQKYFFGYTRSTSFGTTYVPPTTTTFVSTDLNTNVSTTTGQIDKTTVKAGLSPLNVTVFNLGITNNQFGQVKNKALVTFKWERMAPSQSIGLGTAGYWKKTAP